MKEPVIRVERCEQLDDIHAIKLEDLYIIVCDLINLYGQDALLRFDAGYNNIGVDIEYIG